MRVAERSDSPQAQCVRWLRDQRCAVCRMVGWPAVAVSDSLAGRRSMPLPLRGLKSISGKAIPLSLRPPRAFGRGVPRSTKIAVLCPCFGADANRFRNLESDSPGKMLDLESTLRIGNEKSPFNNRIGKIREICSLKTRFFACKNRRERMQDPRRRRRSRTTGIQDRGEEKGSFCRQRSLKEEKWRCTELEKNAASRELARIDFLSPDGCREAIRQAKCRTWRAFRESEAKKVDSIIGFSKFRKSTQ